ncbi:MAG TPA: hypothetical protein VN725_06510 [Rhodanobacteraceae bacterium]|nr:hypothetical protein [Rhodanobacteraceae bacterium]
MTLSRFVLWLRTRGDVLVNRCTAVIQRRRMRLAEAQLAPEARAQASFWRARYLARNLRLQREREARSAQRESRVPSPDHLPAPSISKAEVLAAIARSRARREARFHPARDDDGKDAS